MPWCIVLTEESPLLIDTMARARQHRTLGGFGARTDRNWKRLDGCNGVAAPPDRDERSSRRATAQLHQFLDREAALRRDDEARAR